MCFGLWSFVFGICLGFSASDLGFLLLQQRDRAHKKTLFMQSKPNFPLFWAKNRDSAKKQTQSKPKQTQFSTYPRSVSAASSVDVCSSMTRQAGGVSSGTIHLLPQRWQRSMSGLRPRPQLWQVTRAILGRVSRYVR